MPPSPSSSPTGGPISTPLSGRSRSPPSSLDLSCLPPLIEPTPPSNTLLITNLTNPSLFLPASLETIHSYLAAASGTELASFSPLKSLRRIIVSFPTTEPAIAVRQELDRTSLLGCIARVYFGAPTPVNPETRLLKAPVSDKQFFISPPPSPPFGWTMKDEDPPNREVHAADLATALAGLRADPKPNEDARGAGVADGAGRAEDRVDTAVPVVPVQRGDEDAKMGEAVGQELASEPIKEHRRGSSTVVYEPAAHGAYMGLPAVMVEDTTDEGLKLDQGDTRIREHTARPPVELMH